MYLSMPTTWVLDQMPCRLLRWDKEKIMDINMKHKQGEVKTESMKKKHGE